MMGKRSRVDAMASRAAVESPVVSSVARHTDMLRPGKSWTVTPTSPSGGSARQQRRRTGQRSTGEVKGTHGKSIRPFELLG